MRGRWLFLLLAAPAGAQEAEDPVALLLKQAEDPDARARSKAMRGLSRAGGERAVRAARAALDDGDDTVRAVAAVALVRLGAPDAKVVDALARALSHPDWHTRWDACIALGSLGPAAETAAQALLDAAADKERDLGREAAIALSRVASKDPQVLAGMLKLLESDRDVDRLSLLLGLDAAGQIALARDWLAKEFIANRHGLRAKSATFLGRCGVEGMDRLVKALEDEDPTVRRGVVYLLGRNPKVGAPVFVASLSDPAPEIRYAAIAALQVREAKETAPRIAALLTDRDREVRQRAARAIEDLDVPVPEAGPGLVLLFAEGDPELRAFAAMQRSGFASLAAFLEGKFEAVPGIMRPVFRVRLQPRSGSLEHAAALLLLVATLEDNRHGAALVAALRETLADDEDELLVLSLGSDDEAVRRAAASLLGLLARDREKALRALGEAAKDRHPDVRQAAAKAIERLKDR